MAPLQRASLPGPLEIWAPSAFDATVLYREIVTDRTYTTNGIALHEGNIVFDVGANIGLFALHLARTVPRVQVHAFEPMPETYEALRLNIAEHAPGVRTYNLALAEQPGEALFEFDRFAPMAATMYPEVFNEGADGSASLTRWAAAGLADFDAVCPGKTWVRLARRGLEIPAVRAAVLVALALGFAGLRLRRRVFLKHRRCKLQTLSQALDSSGVERVDLVKIDAEGSEEAILAGIADSDWPRFRQFVIEVHDISGRLERMSKLLEARGYRTVLGRENWETHKLLGISTLYAMHRDSN